MDLSINPNGPFKVHMLNEDGKMKAGVIASVFNAALDAVISVARPDPEQVQPSLRDPGGLGHPAVNELELTQCILKLQEASFYAKRAMAMLPENQQ